MKFFIGCCVVCFNVFWKNCFCRLNRLLCLVIVLCIVFSLVVIWLWMVNGKVSRLFIDFCMWLCELVCLMVMLIVLWKFGQVELYIGEKLLKFLLVQYSEFKIFSVCVWYLVRVLLNLYDGVGINGLCMFFGEGLKQYVLFLFILWKLICMFGYYWWNIFIFGCEFCWVRVSQLWLRLVKQWLVCFCGNGLICFLLVGLVEVGLEVQVLCQLVVWLWLFGFCVGLNSIIVCCSYCWVLVLWLVIR